jgi:hypothetical protein
MIKITLGSRIIDVCFSLRSIINIINYSGLWIYHYLYDNHGHEANANKKNYYDYEQCSKKAEQKKEKGSIEFR